jgi:UDPglucose 6-dehydrogenase
MVEAVRATTANGGIMTRVAVVGTGYVGMTTAVCLAHLGHDVVGADIDDERVRQLNAGAVPIVEAGIDTLLAEGLRSGRLRFSSDPATAVCGAEVVFICVPTPEGSDGSADLSYIEAAAAQIAPCLDSEAIVVNKSTVPVGSAKIVERVLQRPDVFVVSNPEFLREGSAVHDFLHPDRIVIGADERAAAIRVSSLYLGIPAPVIVTDPASAETIKYAANAFLATKISFINAVAAVCEAVGADVDDVIAGVGFDKRIGEQFLRPGPGWGGSCFPKDSRALVRIAEDAGYDFELLKGVIVVNEQQIERIIGKIEQAAGGSVAGKVIGAWGLTFKARTDDLRESPSLAILSALSRKEAVVRAFDPTVKGQLPGIEVLLDPYAVCDGADVLAVLTEWDEFRWLDLDKVASLMVGREIVDARNLLDRAAARRAGFGYQGVGR